MSSPTSTTTDISPSGLGDIAFVGLGSNLPSSHGSPPDTLRQAIQLLRNLSRKPLLCSSIWISEPLDCPENSPDFANAVVGLYPQEGESAESLLSRLFELEITFDRERSEIQNAPRTLDLDLISFGHQELIQEALIIPHPRANSRAFVLFPLEEIAPDFVLPGQEKLVRELAAALRQHKPRVFILPG